MTAAHAVTASLLVWALAIAVIDWRQRRVPNVLLLAMVLPTLGWLIWRGEGPLGVTWPASLAGLGLGLVLTLPGYLASRLGAGDVKLAATMGLVQGMPEILWTLLVAGLVLGAMSLAAVQLMGFANARQLRIPAAVALSAGFGAVLVSVAGGWR